MPDYHYISNFNTKLSPQEEAGFQQWAVSESEKAGKDKFRDLEDYDLRGAWKEIQSGEMKPDERGHLGDKYKKPNHPTFSDQSIYHNTKDPKTGERYLGGTWGEKGDTFAPSTTMLQKQPKGFLQQYFQKYEPNTKLVLPGNN